MYSIGSGGGAAPARISFAVSEVDGAGVAGPAHVLCADKIPKSIKILAGFDVVDQVPSLGGWS